MKKLCLMSIITVVAFLSYQQLSFAVCGEGPPDTFTCTTNPPNPDPTGVQQSGNANPLTINVQDGAGIDTLNGNGGDCIDPGNMGNDINITGGDLLCDGHGIDGNGSASDTVDVTDSRIEAGTDSIFTISGDDVINVLRSTLIAGDDCIGSGSGDDIVNVTDTTCTAEGEGIELSGSGSINMVNVLRSHIICGPGASSGCEAIEGTSTIDIISIVESTVRGMDRTIRLGSKDDILTLGTGSNVEGLIDCQDDFDTLIFAMDVPEEAVNFVTSEILTAGTPDGSVTINGLFYEWENCELLVAELNGVSNVRPIPTLSEWGLIAMAGVLGIISLLAIRRRKLAT